MFTKRIIPCLDVNKGRVVKGVNFVNLKDAGDPVEIAKAYDAAGADRTGISGHHRFLRSQGYGGGYGTGSCRQCIYSVYRRRRDPDGGKTSNVFCGRAQIRFP